MILADFYYLIVLDIEFYIQV